MAATEEGRLGYAAPLGTVTCALLQSVYSHDIELSTHFDQF